MVCIDEEVPFEIPDNWCFARLGCVCDYLHRGKSPKYGTAQVLPIIAQKCNQWDKIYTDRCLISDLSFIDKYTAEQYLQKGDIIINSTGGGTVGRTGIIEDYLFEKYPKYVADSHVTVVRGNRLLSPRYIYYYLISPIIQTGIEERCSGSTNQIELGTSTIYNYLITVPPYKEQLRIVELMKVILQKVEKYGREQEKLENLSKLLPIHLKKSILQEAIQGRLVPQDPNDEVASVLLQRIKEEKLRLVKEGKLKKKDVIDSTIFRGDDNKYYEQIGQEIKDVSEELPFEIPANWEWCRLRDLCLIFTGATFRKDEAKIDCKGVRILRGGNILPFEIIQKTDDIFLSPEQVKEDILLKQNDIITPAVTSLENIGKMARVGQDMPNVTVGGFVFLIRPHYSDEWLSKFLLFFMSSPSAIEFMKSITNKSGQAFYNIGKERLATTLVPIPPKDEERRIVVKIEDLFDRIKGN